MATTAAVNARFAAFSLPASASRPATGNQSRPPRAVRLAAMMIGWGRLVGNASLLCSVSSSSSFSVFTQHRAARDALAVRDTPHQRLE
jgi:hypothetical protein